MSVRASVIIVSYNQAALLEQCLVSLRAYIDGEKDEIIVVDNQSTGTGVKALASRFPQVRFVFLECNQGFGQANNIAVRQYAQGKYLLFLNSDAVLIEPVIEAFIIALEQFPKVRILGPGLLNSDQTVQTSTHGFPSLTKECLRLFRTLKTWAEHPRLAQCWSALQTLLKTNLLARFESYSTSIREVEFVSGACCFMEKAFFEQMGGFDDRFFMYLEDTDLCFRARLAGYSILFCPAIKVIHQLHGSSPSPGANHLPTHHLQRYRSLFCFYEKNYGPLATARLRWALRFCLTIRLIILWPLSTIITQWRPAFREDWALLVRT